MDGLNENLKEMLQDFLKQFKRNITEEILTDVLCSLYFLDCNKQCNYDKMTGAEIVKIYHEELDKLEKRYKFSLSDEFFGIGFSGGDDDD